MERRHLLGLLVLCGFGQRVLATQNFIQLQPYGSETKFNQTFNSISHKVLDCSLNNTCNCWRDMSITVEAVDYYLFYGTIQSLADHLRQNLSSSFSLELSDSDVYSLSSNIFRNFSFEKLCIHYSNLSIIEDGAFDEVTSLKILALDNNQLEQIPNITWQEVILSLEEIDLSYNRIQKIENELRALIALRRIDISHNSVSTITPGAFDSVTKMEVLDLTGNAITQVDDSLFLHNNFLSNLSLSGNHISRLNNALKPLTSQLTVLCCSNNLLEDAETMFTEPATNITILYLNDNVIPNLTTAFTSKIPGVTDLHLDSSCLQFIERSAFTSFKSLTSIALRENQLEFLDGAIFNDAPVLNEVRLSNNNLTTAASVLSVTQLQYVYLEANQITRLQNTGYNPSELAILVLDNNPLGCLENGSFSNYMQLNFLSVANCDLEILESHVFDPLTMLTLLNMSNNHLSSLNGTLAPLISLRELDLSSNSLTSVNDTDFNTLHVLDRLNLGYNQLLHVDGAFQPLIALQTLTLSYNNLTYLTANSFSKQHTYENIQVYVEGNPIGCDCRLQWLLEEKQSYHNIDELYCSSPTWLQNRSVGSLSVEDVVKWERNCSENCTCKCVSDSTTFHIAVTCSSSTFPEIIPQETEVLTIENASLVELPKNISQYAALTELHLSDNRLSSIDGVVFPESLEILDLSSNNFSIFPVYALEKMSLKEVDLERNPWRCDCTEEVEEFLKWTDNSNGSEIKDPGSIICADIPANGKARNMSLTSLRKSEICVSPSVPDVLPFIAIVVGLVAIFLVVFLYYRFSLYLKIWLYYHGIIICIKEDELDEDKPFDAFVSYSSFDEDFVVHQFVPRIESGEPNYQLCLHYKHFTAGEFIHDNIFKAIENSRRTILLLSKNFLQSEWCRLEFRRAHQKVLKDRVNRLIVVILGDLPPKEEIDDDIKLHLTTSTYLKWGESYFWQKFRYAMPKNNGKDMKAKV